MLQNFLNPLKQATTGLSEPPAPIPLAKCPQAPLVAASLDSQLHFAWVSPSPAQVVPISDCFIAHARVALGRTQEGLDLGPHQAGNPRTCTPSGQLHSTSDLSPCPHTADPPWRAESGGQ